MVRISAVWLLLLLYSLSSFGQGNPEQSNVFIAEDIGLISPSESRALSTQAASGIHSSTKIQPHRPPSQLSRYKTVLNTSAILSTVAMTEADQTKLNAHIDTMLAAHRKVKPGTADNSDGALYSSISLQQQNGETILEVLVAVADWADTKQRSSEGPVPALAKSTVWSHISRRKLAHTNTERPSFESIESEIVSLYQGAIRNLLLAF